MARLPQPGGDDGTWGQILNDYLSVIHEASGALKASTVSAAVLATSNTPSNGQILGYSGGTLAWTNAGSSDPAMGGDLSGTASNAQLVANAVGPTELASNAVTTAKIADTNVTDAKIASGVSQSKITNLVSDLAGKEPTITAGTTAQYWRGDKSWQTLDKAAVGLANIDNTSDANKPVSTAQQTALDAKADTTVTDALDTRVDALESAGIVTLSDGATIATDAAAGKHFRVTVAGDRTLGVPTNATDGMRRIWEVTASAADRTLTLTTGSAGSFELTTNITSPIVIANGKTLFLGAVYNASRNRWTVLASQATS